MRASSCCVAVVIASFLVAPLVKAQVSASIAGSVVDESQAGLPGVTVRATNVETGLVRHGVTTRAGQFMLTGLPVGRYEVRADKEGFTSAVRSGITLAVGEHATLQIVLAVRGPREQVTVSGNIPALSLGSGEISGLVGERQVKDLPLNGRSYDELLTLDPGVVNYTSEKTGGVGVSNSAVGNMFAVSGRRPQENLFLLNGVEFTGAAEINLQPGGTSGELLGVDAVREFNVLRDTYGAEYGKRPGAQVAIVTESGSNQWHATAFEFLRNSALDARNFFDRGPIPPFQRNQFGGSVGGPVHRDRDFVFANYEGFRQQLGLSDVTLVPDENARRGYLPGPAGGLLNVGLAPGVEPLLALWPVPNGRDLGGGIAEAFSHPSQTIREDFGNTRVDHIFSEQDALSAVYTLDDSADATPTSNPLSFDLESLREQVLSLDETHVFSPQVLNTARFGFSRASYFYTGESTVSAPGFVTGRPVGALVIGGGSSPNSASQISLAGANIGSHLFATRNLFTYEDRVSLTRGLHQLSAGAWFERIQANDTLALGQYGQASFASLQSFLQGNVTAFTAVPSPTPLGWRSLEGAWYVEDSMRLAPSLTASLGFRDEFTTGWNEATARASNYVFAPDGTIETEPRVGRSVFTVNRAKFLPQPRVGLAWKPCASSRTILRAGFGLYNDLQDGLSYRLDQNAPFNTTFSLRNVPVSTLQIAPGTGLPAGALVAPAGVQPNLQTPTVEAYTFEIQQGLGADTVLTVGYAGSHAYHEIVSVDANEPLPTLCPAAPCPSTLPAGTVFYPRGAPLANPAVANTWSWFSEGTSSYNALEVEVNRRAGHGLGLRGSYTWSKTLDNGDTLNGSAAANAPGLVMNPRNLRVDWGPATFDVRNLAVVQASYDLPFGHGARWLAASTGWRNALAAGWMLNAIETLQSGFPFTPQLSFNPSNNGDTRNSVRPSVNPAFSGRVILGEPSRYFDPRAFVVPLNGTYGNVARDSFAGPGLAVLDLSILKNVRLNEKLRLQFRGEVFNAFNAVNLNTPNLIVFTSPAGIPSSAAGVVTSTSTTSREIQFGVKLSF